LEEVEFELEVRNLLVFINFLSKLGFSLYRESTNHLPDGSIEVTFNLYLDSTEAGKLKARYIDSFFLDYQRLFKLREYSNRTLESLGKKSTGKAYWAIPIEPIRIVLYEEFTRLLDLFEDYSDDYPSKEALEVLEHLRSRTSSY